MGYGQPLVASTRYEMLGRVNGTGTTVAAHASANTKGSYVTLGTATFDYDGFWFTAGRSQTASTGVAYRYDIAVNNGGSDTIICQDLFYEGSTLWYLQTPSAFYIPVRIKNGAVVKVRCQSSAGGDYMYPSLQGVGGDNHLMRGFTSLIACTDWTNTAPTNAGLAAIPPAQTGWVEVCASTAYRVAALYLGLALKAAGGSTFLDCMFDVAMGVGGSEMQLFTVHAYDDTINGTNSALLGAPAGPYPVDIPAGTRLSVRMQGSFTSASGILYPTLFGICP